MAEDRKLNKIRPVRKMKKQYLSKQQSKIKKDIELNFITLYIVIYSVLTLII